MDIIYRYDPFGPIQPRPLKTPDDAIRVLDEGHGRFTHILEQIHAELVEGTSATPIVIKSDPLPLTLAHLSGAAPIQAPFALVLGCSDARVPVEQIFDLSPNDLFVVRVAGNVLGIECLGSIDYAVENFSHSLQLVIVMGHSNCGAVAAAVDSYIDPNDYSEIKFPHALRSLVDRLHIAVRGAAGELERLCGTSVIRDPGYRGALIEVAVYINAALTAFDVRRELDLNANSTPRVVYAVFDLVRQRVGAFPFVQNLPRGQTRPIFGEVPETSEGFAELGAEFARRAVAAGFIHQTSV